MRTSLKLLPILLIAVNVALIVYGVYAVYDGKPGYGLFMVGTNSAFVVLNLITLSRTF